MAYIPGSNLRVPDVSDALNRPTRYPDRLGPVLDMLQSGMREQGAMARENAGNIAAMERERFQQNAITGRDNAQIAANERAAAAEMAAKRAAAFAQAQTRLAEAKASGDPVAIAQAQAAVDALGGQEQPPPRLGGLAGMVERPGSKAEPLPLVLSPGELDLSPGAVDRAMQAPAEAAKPTPSAPPTLGGVGGPVDGPDLASSIPALAESLGRNPEDVAKIAARGYALLQSAEKTTGYADREKIVREGMRGYAEKLATQKRFGSGGGGGSFDQDSLDSYARSVAGSPEEADRLISVGRSAFAVARGPMAQRAHDAIGAIDRAAGRLASAGARSAAAEAKEDRDRVSDDRMWFARGKANSSSLAADIKAAASGDQVAAGLRSADPYVRKAAITQMQRDFGGVGTQTERDFQTFYTNVLGDPKQWEARMRQLFDMNASEEIERIAGQIAEFRAMMKHERIGNAIRVSLASAREQGAGPDAGLSYLSGLAYGLPPSRQMDMLSSVWTPEEMATLRTRDALSQKAAPTTPVDDMSNGDVEAEFLRARGAAPVARKGSEQSHE